MADQFIEIYNTGVIIRRDRIIECSKVIDEENERYYLVIEYLSIKEPVSRTFEFPTEEMLTNTYKFLTLDLCGGKNEPFTQLH